MTEQKNKNRINRSLLRFVIMLKRLMQTAALILLLLVIAFFLLNSSQFLNWSKSRIIGLLSSTLDNKIEYSQLDFNFFRGIEIKNLVLYDHHEDTLIYSDKISISFSKSLMSLLKRELSFRTMLADNIYVNIRTYQGENDSNVEIFLRQFQNKKSSGNAHFEFNISAADLHDAKVVITDDNTGNKDLISTMRIQAAVRRMDLLAKIIIVDRIDITDPVISLVRTGNIIKTKHEISSACTDSTCIDPMLMLCEQINITNGQFSLDNINVSKDTLSIPHFNPKRFQLSGIDLKLNQLFNEAALFTAAGMNASMRINDHLDLNTLQFKDLLVKPGEVNITKFKILTENSRIGDSLYLHWSTDTASDWKENSFVDFNLRDSRISAGDLLYFIPTLNKNKYLKTNQELQAEVAAHLTGRISSLKAFDLAVDIPNKLEFKGDAFTRNITSRGEELLNLNIQHLLSNSDFIQRLIPSLDKVKVFRQLGQFKYSGRFDGYMEDFVSYGTFISDLGVFKSDIRLNLRPGTEKATWSGSLQLQDFNLGALIQSKDLGIVSLKADIHNGIGLHIDRMSAEMKGDIQYLSFKNYGYQNIHLDATVNKNLFDGIALIKDKNLDCSFKGKIAGLNNVPKLTFSANISKIDLKALNLGDKPFILSGLVNADITDLDLNKIQGSLQIEKGLLYDYEKNHVLQLGNASFIQNLQSGEYRTTLRSDFVNLDAQGVYKAKSLYDQLMSFMRNTYPDIFSDLGLKFNETSEPVKLVATIELRELNRIAGFFDIDLRANSLSGKLAIDGRDQRISADFQGSYIRFGNVQLKDMVGTVSGQSGVLETRILGSSVSINNKSYSGNVDFESLYENNVMHFTFRAMDSLNKKEMYHLRIGSVKSGNLKKFYLEGEDLLIAGTKWNYNEVSSLELGKDYIAMHEFELYDSSSTIRIADLYNKGIRLDARSFDLSMINGLLKSGSLTFTGLFDLSLDIKDIFHFKGVEGQLDILNMRINKVSYGRFDIDFAMEDPDRPLSVKINNNFKETSINMTGTLNIPLTKNYTLPRYDFDLKGTAKGFQLYFLESFIASISATKGTLTGPIRIFRENKKIYMEGECVAEDGSTKINYLNTTYTFNHQKIRFNRDLIVFENNVVYDELGNPITANGIIRQDNLTYFDLDINIRSRKALVLNTSKSDNIYYYGYGIMSFECSFQGLTSKMDMNFKGRSEKGSKFVIPVRYDQESKDTKFIRFRSQDTIISSTPTPVVIKGLNIRMDIEVTEDCEMSIIFDEKNGDILRGNGSGNIQVAALRDNTFDIKGNYEISAGQYLFTLMNFVNKPFRIKKGGTIIWTGDPLNADINLEASYDGIYISPSALIEEYTISDPTIQNRARERTKLDLSMLLRGSLLQPDINFRISFPEVNGSIRNLVDTKIKFLEQNPEQMNQQVASLILFRTFINTNSGLNFQSGVQKTTANTLTEFLTNQASLFFSSLLTDLYQNVGFISGVDFNVNYDINRTVAGTQTNASELVFNVRHRLWNDQWAVSIGANYGNSSAFNPSNSYFNPESIIEWNTPVTGLKVRVYYKGTDGIDGTRHRAGTGVSYRREFNSFSDFKKGLREQKVSSGAIQ
ncbi:MAG: translocation/assembly module TamB domain-containing protein [Saprospiraceae bacterium]